jgi:hypothetical protein
MSSEIDVVPGLLTGAARTLFVDSVSPRNIVEKWWRLPYFSQQALTPGRRAAQVSDTCGCGSLGLVGPMA